LLRDDENWGAKGSGGRTQWILALGNDLAFGFSDLAGYFRRSDLNIFGNLRHRNSRRSRRRNSIVAR